MPAEDAVSVRPFERRDRDQLTELVNLHVAAVIPGVVVSVNAVLSQLEREPGEAIVDPWVADRRCLVAELDHRIVAGVLLHRFRADADVADGYRGIGDIRWFVCHPDALAAGERLLAAGLRLLRRWDVPRAGIDCTLPAPACYGVPDVAPHLRRLVDAAGFAGPSRTELVLAARCTELVRDTAPVPAVRTVGRLGARFTVAGLGYVEVCPLGVDHARSAGTERWADVGDLVVADGADPEVAATALLDVAARWLLRGDVTHLLDYWAADEESPEILAARERIGFDVLVRNERGFVLEFG